MDYGGVKIVRVYIAAYVPNSPVVPNLIESLEHTRNENAQ
jgi:hypothetical protein